MFIQSRSRKSISSFLSGLLDRVRCAVARRNEMQRLDSQEIEAIARELNLSAAELGALAFTNSGSLNSLDTRLVHAGFSQETLAASHGDVLRDLRRVCGQCPSKARCARDLARERQATPSKYCPNEQTLRALEYEAHQRTSAQVLSFPAARV